MPEVLIAPPTHAGVVGARRSPYIRGAPLPYNSTHSFADARRAPSPAHRKPPRHAQDPYVPRAEVVHSSIPAALEDPADPDAPRRRRRLHEAVPYTVVWRGPAHSVVLARAGHDNWKGRQPMERE